ncbi:MAG: hypothetical protein A2Z97_08685 [Bdellovibrionales bacterium GWB1_52_6]|nr:MAG: hypothetical protein A2Z97_08685 [Bdellovibrionales bacterium GWB1_52_6]OFZ03080.1 MAG: hypothetical protein A2X97_09585 [Bdellovibrionales bacterium GWA1_52_35]
MQISLLNSKKCLTASALVLVLLGGSTSSFASTTVQSHADVLAAMRKQLQSRSGTQFQTLLAQWENRYSTRAVEPLFTLARDSKLPDTDRYIALMGGAKLGGISTSRYLVPLLKDPIWMIRSGALRALSAIQAQEGAPAVLALLKDPALVVRLEAVQTIAKLRPAGSAEALLAAAKDPANFHKGKAQWVPQKALAALTLVGNSRHAAGLKPLLEKQDHSLQLVTVQTLEKLTGKVLKKGQPLKIRVNAWNAYL